MGESTSLLELITAIGSVVTPILIVALSAVTVAFQRRADAALKREETQREVAQKREEAQRERALKREEEQRERGLKREEEQREAAQKREEAQRERAQRLEEGIRADRIQIYQDILDPFIAIFGEVKRTPTSDARPRPKSGRRNQQREPKSAIETIGSDEYREAAFKLSLFANDDAVRAFNELLQFAYQAESQDRLTSSTGETDEARTLDFLHAFGTLLLEIRRSVGNETTTLSALEMLEWLISDLRSQIASVEAVRDAPPPT